MHPLHEFNNELVTWERLGLLDPGPSRRHTVPFGEVDDTSPMDQIAIKIELQPHPPLGSQPLHQCPGGFLSLISDRGFPRDGHLLRGWGACRLRRLVLRVVRMMSVGEIEASSLGDLRVPGASATMDGHQAPITQCHR